MVKFGLGITARTWILLTQKDPTEDDSAEDLFTVKVTIFWCFYQCFGSGSASGNVDLDPGTKKKS